MNPFLLQYIHLNNETVLWIVLCVIVLLTLDLFRDYRVSRKDRSPLKENLFFLIAFVLCLLIFDPWIAGPTFLMLTIWNSGRCKRPKSKKRIANQCILVLSILSLLFFEIKVALGCVIFLSIVGLNLGSDTKQDWEDEAEAIGFVYVKDLKFLWKRLKKMHYFASRSGRFVNLMVGKVDDRETLVGETGSPKMHNEAIETVCVIRTLDEKLPPFYLRRKRFLIDPFFKFKDPNQIYFEEHPEFDRVFTLQSETPELAKQLFTEEVRNFFLQHQTEKWKIESQSRHLLIFIEQNSIFAIFGFPNKRLHPAETGPLRKMTLETVKVLEQAASTDTIQTEMAALLATNPWGDQENDHWPEFN